MDVLRLGILGGDALTSTQVVDAVRFLLPLVVIAGVALAGGLVTVALGFLSAVSLGWTFSSNNRAMEAAACAAVELDSAD